MKITIAGILWSLIGRLMISVNCTYLLYPEMNLNGYFNSLRFPFKCCINSSNIRLLKSKQLCCFHRPHATVNIYETIFHPEYHKRIFHMHIYVQHACHWNKHMFCSKIYFMWNENIWLFQREILMNNSQKHQSFMPFKEPIHRVYGSIYSRYDPIFTYMVFCKLNYVLSLNIQLLANKFYRNFNSLLYSQYFSHNIHALERMLMLDCL